MPLARYVCKTVSLDELTGIAGCIGGPAMFGAGRAVFGAATFGAAKARQLVASVKPRTEKG